MNEIDFYSMKQIFSFWQKYERFYGIVKKIFWISFILNPIFWALYIPIKDENFRPLFALVFIAVVMSIVNLLIQNNGKEKLATLIFLVGCIVFIFSYFTVFPMPKTGSERCTSFLTTKSEKLINYASFQWFHIPLYHKHFSYNPYQQRIFMNTEDNSEITVVFKFDFDELIKNTLKNGEEVFVSKNRLNKMVDQKMKLLEVFIKQFGLSKELLKDSILNENWLKITSFKIEFNPIILQ